MKIIILGSCVLLVAALLLLGLLVFTDDVPYLGYNRYEDRVEVASSDGRYIATGCHIIGGATTTDSTFVVIRSKEEALDYKKNDLLFMVDNLGPFDIAWINNNELIVKYTSGPIYIQKFKWKDVSINYILK